MSRLSHWLDGGPLITDGAWGTEMQKRGLMPGTNPDGWNLENPQAVLDVARAYVASGSQIILTNTFRANAVAMPEASTELLEAINREGVALSRRASAGTARVVASMGPSGKVLMMGEVSAEEVTRAFTAQSRALAEAGADALLIETMSDPEEALLALAAAKQTGLPVIVSFAFDTGRNNDRTMMGALPEQIGERLRDAGADAVGANCGAGVEGFAKICSRLRESSGLPVWIKANAGLPVVEDGTIRYTTTAEDFASHLPSLLEAGASFVGGCCGTSPEFIAALVERRKQCTSV